MMYSPFGLNLKLFGLTNARSVGITHCDLCVGRGGGGVVGRGRVKGGREQTQYYVEEGVPH
jgi:hypothetical protein